MLKCLNMPVVFLTVYDVPLLSCSTYEQQKQLPTLRCRFVFIVIFTLSVFSKFAARLLSEEKMICFLLEQDTVVLF